MIDDLSEEVLKTIVNKTIFQSWLTNQRISQIKSKLLYVGEDMELNKDFVALCPISRCTAEEIVNVFISVMASNIRRPC